jgi:hypothetical protein
LNVSSALRSITIPLGNAAGLARTDVCSFVLNHLQHPISRDPSITVASFRHLSSILYHLSFHPDTAVDVAQKGLIPSLTKLLRSSDQATYRLAYWTLANLAANPRTQAAMLDQRGLGIFSFLDACLASDDEQAHTSVAWGFANLMAQPQSRLALLRVAAVDTFYSWMGQLLKHRNLTLRTSAAWALALALSVPAGKTTPISPPPSSVLKRLQDIVLERSTEKPLRKLALICIANLSARPTAPWLLLSCCDQLITKLFDLLSPGDVEHQRVLSYLLANLAYHAQSSANVNDEVASRTQADEMTRLNILHPQAAATAAEIPVGVQVLLTPRPASSPTAAGAAAAASFAPTPPPEPTEPTP